MPRALYAALAAVLALIVAAAPAAHAAAPAPIDCTEGRYAVGGYPRTHLVPPGYTAVHTPGGILPWEAGGYTHGQTVGAANVVAALDAYAAACPAAPIRLQGHSYGAGVVHTALETIDARPYAPRVHVYMTGNPRHPGGIEDTWSWVRLPGLAFRGAGIAPRNLGSFVDRCNPRDGICDMPPVTRPVQVFDHIVGYLTGAHAYP